MHGLSARQGGLETLREAETLCEQLNDDRRRGRVCTFMTSIHTQLGELDEALVAGTRALEIAERLGDLRLRISTTTQLEFAHYARTEYERVVALATDNLAVLPADWLYESFGGTAPTSVHDRNWLVMSLAHLGRFAEAAEDEAEAVSVGLRRAGSAPVAARGGSRRPAPTWAGSPGAPSGHLAPARTTVARPAPTRRPL
jgi:hypothetical protein